MSESLVIEEEIRSAVEQFQTLAVEIRRDLHMWPELSGKEERTSSVVARHLESLGLEVHRCAKSFGVWAVLRGQRRGPTVALRADMDALPLEEATGLPYSSKNPGVMHACGHDMHTAVLMGVASVLSNLRDRLQGNVVFLFQPSEEFFPGGALGMIQEGALQDPSPDAVFALHCSALPVGTIGVAEGPIIGSVSTLSLRILGKGGHFSSPHQAVDPIVVASHVVVALNSMMTRRVDPLDSAVLTFGMIQGGTRDNIIGEQVVLRGNIGSLDEAMCRRLMEDLERTVKGVTESFGATYRLKYIHGYPTTINNPVMTRYLRCVAGEILGDGKVLDQRPVLGGEDFSYFLQHVPGAIFFLGTRNPQKEPAPVPNHDPRFCPDEEAIPVGMTILSHLAAQFHRHKEMA